MVTIADAERRRRNHILLMVFADGAPSGVKRVRNYVDPAHLNHPFRVTMYYYYTSVCLELPR